MANAATPAIASSEGMEDPDKIAAGSSWTDRHLNQTGPDRWDGVASC
jgi:hypothetical protein